jgi:outer membrane receptor for ferrienterochelin and colicin
MKTTVPALLAALLVTCSVHLSAQGAPGLKDLRTATLEDLLNVTVTTASRTAEGLAEAPARVQVVTAAQIQRRGYQSVADLLKDLSDFKVDLSGDQDYPTELTVGGMRGASRVVLLLDGIRISSPTNEPLPILANYPVHSARQIEIMYGPASALYGADAFSAVINIVSREVVEAPGLAFGTSVGQFGLFNQTASYGAQLGPNATLMLSGQFLYDRQPDLSKSYPSEFGGLAAQHSGTFNTIFGPMTPGGSVSPDYSIPLSAHSLQAILRTGGLRLMLFQNHSRVSSTPAYTPDNGVYNADAFNRNKLWVGAASYTRPIGRVTSTSTVTFSRHELDPESGYWNVYSNLKKSYKYAFGSMAKAEEQLSWKPRASITVTTGGTFEHFYSIPQGADLNAPIRSRNEPGTILDTNITDEFIKLRYSNTGAFGQMHYSMRPGVSVTFGARTDYNTRYGATFNPRVGIVTQPASRTTVKLLYGSAYLAPSPYQENSHYGSFYSTDGGRTYASSYWHLGNPNLKPQQKKTVEVNVLQGLGRSFQLSGSAFYSRFTHTVKESDADQAYAGSYLGWPVDYIDFPVNEGRATTYGGTVGLEFLRVLDSDRAVEAHTALTLADGRVWGQNQGGASLPIGAMAPVQLRLGTDIDWHRWSVAPRLTLVGSQRLLATTTESGSVQRRTLDGYALVDINIRRQALFKNIAGFVTIQNALDKRYRTINARAYTNPEELIGAPQNPRRIALGFDVRLK